MHKTATTSLQASVFTGLRNKKFIGRYLSPKDNENTLYQDITNYCFSDTERCEIQESRLIQQLGNESQEMDLVLSDEWFTSDYSGNFGFYGGKWQSKIIKLSNILAGLDSKVLVTLREPIEGLFSQYCEFNTVGIMKYHENFMDYAIRSNDSKAYFYQELNEFLSSYFSDITYLTFEQICNGKYKSILKSYFELSDVPEIFALNERLKKKNNLGEIEFFIPGNFRKKIASIVPLRIRRLLKRSLFLNGINKKLITFFGSKYTVKAVNDIQREELEVVYKNSILFYKALKENELE